MTETAAPTETAASEQVGSEPATSTTRRQVLATAGVAAAAVALTAACGSSSSSERAAASSTPSGSGSSPSGTSASPSAAGGGAGLVAAASVPVGGGVVIPDKQVVVTQPTSGTFKAFSAVCTHQGCLVSTVADGSIDCPCHGSKFSATDGSVQQGPASSPLAAVNVSVSGGQVTLA
jgi:Rieske Fe-S protein